jgi:hypothetical protein
VPDAQTRAAVTARLAVWLFPISTAFPVAAGAIGSSSLPRWVGWLDVIVAAALAASCITLDVLARRLVTPADELVAARMYRHGSALILVLLVTFLIAGGRIDWNVLLPGLAWRAWFFIYSLPVLLAARRGASF